MAKRKLRRRRGATLVESMLVIVMITFLFWCFFLVFDLAMMKIVTNHAAFLMGRSHIVGFNNDISNRARNVGLIPISGGFVTPDSLNGSNQIDIAGREPYLIQDYVQEYTAQGNGDLLEYKFWDYARDSGGGDSDGTDRYTVTMSIPETDVESEYASEHRFNIIPGIWSFTNENTYSTEGSSKLMNHSAYYLNGVQN